MIKWRNLYLRPSKILLRLCKEHHLRNIVDDFGNMLILASEDVKWAIIDEFYKKKGLVFKDGNKRVAAKLT